MTLSSKALVAAITLAVIGGTGLAHADETQKEKVQENFLEADADEDGALTLEEFTKLIDLNADDQIGRARMVKRLGRYETAFGRMDADADGLVTVEEIQAMAERAQNQ